MSHCPVPLWVTHEACLRHDMGHHPERPERLYAINDRLIASGLDMVLHRYDAPLVDRDLLNVAHEPLFVDQVHCHLHRPRRPERRLQCMRVHGGVAIHPGQAQVNQGAKRIAEAFDAEGADCWYEDGAKARFLQGIDDPDAYDQVMDILDVDHLRAQAAPGSAEWAEHEAAVRRLLRAAGPSTVLVIFPLVTDLERYPLDALHAKVAGVAREEGVPVLDLRDALSGGSPELLRVAPWDPHLNEYGLSLAAEATAAFLLERGLVPGAP